MEVVRVFVHVGNMRAELMEDEKLDPMKVADYAYGIMSDGDELHLGEGWYERPTNLSRMEFVDGSEEPEQLKKEADSVMQYYAKQIASFCSAVVLKSHNGISLEKAVLDMIRDPAYQYNMYKAVNQLAGYPDFGIYAVWIDENGCVMAHPEASWIEELSNWSSFLMYYHS